MLPAILVAMGSLYLQHDIYTWNMTTLAFGSDALPQPSLTNDYNALRATFGWFFALVFGPWKSRGRSWSEFGV